MEMRLRVLRPRIGEYDVVGTTFDELSDAMTDRGCWGRYTFPHSFRPVGDPVERINLTIQPRILLPVWTTLARASAPMQREWNRMLAALRAHENEHHRLLTVKAEEFRDSIPNITFPLDRAAANRLMADFEREAQAIMDQYDARTRHGQTEGVMLNDP